MNNSGWAKPWELAIAYDSGIANGNATAYVPQLVPVENAIIIVIICSITGAWARRQQGWNITKSTLIMQSSMHKRGQLRDHVQQNIQLVVHAAILRSLV